MLEIKGYITNLGKYNEGELVGKWIEFPINDDDLQDVLKDIGCAYYDEDGEYINNGYEEIFFTDWDCDFEHEFGEYESIDKINEIAVNIQNWDEDTFNAACEIWGVNEIIENNPDDYYLYSDIENDYDLGYYYISECYNLEKMMGHLSSYFDYDGFGRDIRLESNGGFSSKGWIEYRN